MQMESPVPAHQRLSQAHPDKRFLTGRSNYGRHQPSRARPYAYVLRSPHAHATINSIDTSATKSAPGVVAVFTGEDMQVGGLPAAWLIPQRGRRDASRRIRRSPSAGPPCRRSGGQELVIADTLAQAKNRGKISVNYGVLPAVMDMKRPGRRNLDPDTIGTNKCYDWEPRRQGRR